MNCSNHPELAAQALCPGCSKPYCARCFVRVGDQLICTACFEQESLRAGSNASSHSVSSKTSNPESRVMEQSCSPGTAFALGMVPGVGAICNGEYLKAFVHVMIFGFLISLNGSSSVESFHPLFVTMMIAFYWYMPLEAYQTARRRVLTINGFLLPELSQESRHESLWTGAVLTLMGTLLFLNELVLGFLESALKFWPIVLIGFGVFKIREYIQSAKAARAVDK